MVDDLGYEALGINGGLSYETPHLDSLGSVGMRFTFAFSTPLCTPSRVQIMTGKYSSRNYIGFGLLDPSEPTIAHYLRDAGYATGIAGKWQLYGNEFQRALAGRGGADPKDAGFDEYALWQVRERGLRYKSPTIRYSDRPPREYPGAYGPDMFTEFMIDFMERHRSEPFFLYYPMVLTHSPFQPTPDHPDYDSLDPSAGVNDTSYFASNVAYVDTIVGRITNALHRLGLDRNTLVIFTSDNGTDRAIASEHISGTIHGRKGYPEAAGTHVPLIAYMPGTIKPGSVNDALVDFTDFVPTLLVAAGISSKQSAPTDGLSFFGQLTGDPDTSRSWIYCHYDPRWGNFEANRWAQDHKWKLYADGRLFHWAEDPREMVNLSDSSLGSNAQQARQRLQAVLNRHPPLEPH